MNTHKYRLNWRGVAYHATDLLYADADTPGCILAPLLLFLFLPSLVLSYLKVSPEGVELFHWPNYRVFAAWDRIDRLGQSRFLAKFLSDVLYLEIRQPFPGDEIIERDAGLSEKRIIPLSDFRGWPDGALADDLRRYRPDLLA